ncbi:Ig-like domain-containing protein [Demequina sediminicola]|uniref:Ig-like domain-containing protein n=1 Tax=Demequina sediminicola TaxID=1095026 RepID=UPI00078412E8|nr:Ig-like domain-containing protein [Demequina sediminicola]
MSAVDAGLGRATAAKWRNVRRVAVGALIVAVGAGAFLAPGFDEREVQSDSPAVWAMQSSTGERIGRVNTAVTELDTTKTVDSPSDVVQFGTTLLVYSHNLGSVTTMDVAQPHEVAADAPEGTVATPLGTDVIDYQGNYVAYLTERGEVFAGAVTDGTAVAPAQFDPFAAVDVEEGEERPQFRAVAVAISSEGRLAAYSSERRAVLTASVGGADMETQALPEGPESEDLQVTWVGDSWVLFDAESGLLWMADHAEPVATGASDGARLQRSTDTTEAVGIADEFGLISVDLDASGSTRVHGSTESVVLGVPARPVSAADGSGLVAAWLPEGEGPGTLWRSGQGATELTYGTEALPERLSPTLRSNGTRLIVNETRTGWVWDAYTGELVTSSQAWDKDDSAEVVANERNATTEVTDPRNPIAQADSFGVRAGRQVALPVLLNDHDANHDLLTVEPSSVTALDENFGTVTVADDAQTIVIDVHPEATGTATFTYVVTDGTTDDGLMSEPAQVTVTVKDPSENSAPVWCGTEDCQFEWPRPQVAPGGTVTVDALTGWVDPEGDPIYLLNATSGSTVGVVAASPEGQVVFQHTDASDTDTGSVPVEITVSDVHGATQTKDLSIAVTGEPDLQVEDVAVAVSASVTATVDITGHVTGARGPLTVTEVSLGQDDDAVVATSPGLVGFTFSAPEPGSYLVDFVVSDGVADARGVARVTVTSPDDEQLSTVPLTAFVRSKEDVTVDVFEAVTNPSRAVLLLSDLETEPADGAQLSADIVGHAALRLSGETSDSQPGSLGTVTYVVSDGSGRPQGTARGEVTVVLLGSDVPTRPLAVDDAITVRAGAQADIKVLSNDVAPAGNVIALDADSVNLSEGGGLAFPAGSLVRYLAPDEPGTYTIDYATYVLGYPTQSDTARVVVTVTPADNNQPPIPQPLRGRVASGQEVRIPFDGTGTDPDGDAVTLEEVQTQPTSGAARVASDGRSLVYTADSGFAGQVSFEFTVADARGATATATATVGVLAAELDPRPVTYTDYIQAQVGDDRRVLITPTANDHDLAGGELTLEQVRPDADPDSAEYADLDSRLEGVEEGRVALSVGTEPGTYAYVYTVANDSGSTSIGRIILKAVREPIADVPIIADTVLTSETRETFTSGVDVLTDKVAWGAGDLNALTLSAWGDPDDLDVSGREISGPLPDAARLVPFEVTGQNFAGEDIVSYGFLRVPGEEDVRVALRETFTPPEVNENESITFDLKELIALPAGTPFRIDGDGVAASGVRTEATCELAGGTRLTYSAGAGEPYTDTCQVPVLIDGAETAVMLPVPIIVIPEIPQPILTGAAMEVSPGDSANFDLTGMVSWPAGAAARAVDIAFQYSGQQFTVTRSANTLAVTAADAAVPGHVDAVTVSLPGEPDLAPVTLSLEVGPAPSVLPKGGTVVKTCSQADGSSCTVDVIGGNGEVNPLPGTPLTLDSVSAAGTCSGVAFSVASDSSIRASWTGDTPGAVCNATFVVVDAQGRKSSGDRTGSLSIDLQGYPAGPSAITQTGYGNGTVTLGVDPGSASSSYPSITGFSVTANGREVATCTAQGVCSQVTGLQNGTKVTYSVVAVNSVGQSKSSASTTAWSYVPPNRPALVRWEPTQAGNAGLKADLVLSVSDASTRQLIITSPAGEERIHTVSGRGNQTVSGYLLGSNDTTTVTVTPVTAHELPPTSDGNNKGEALTFSANGVGGPLVSNAKWTPNSEGDQVTFTATIGSAGAGSVTWVGIARSGQHCTPSQQVSGTSVTLTAGIEPNRLTDYDLCAQSRWNEQTYGSTTTDINGVYAYRDPGAPSVDRGYRVANNCTGIVNSPQCNADYTQMPSVRAAQGFSVFYRIVGGPLIAAANLNAGSLPYGRTFDLTAYNCVDVPGVGQRCSQSGATVQAESGGPSHATGVAFTQCTVSDKDVNVTVNAAGSAWTLDSVQWLDSNGRVTDVDWEIRSAKVTVSFSGALTGLQTWTSPARDCGSLVPEPEPDPDPSGGP